MDGSSGHIPGELQSKLRPIVPPPEGATLHQAALHYAAQGFKIFPCLPGTKRPATPAGFYDASSDLKRIDEWWTENPDYNVAFCPDTCGLAVIDLDPGPPEGLSGQDEWDMLQLEHGIAPDTFTVTTPRGGKHVYFKGTCRPTQHHLGKHIDSRGRSSYALLPPSRTPNGQYVVENATAPVSLPDWLPPLLGKPERPLAAAVEGLDLPVNVERACGVLETCIRQGTVSVSGSGGNATAYKVACRIADLGISGQKCLELMIGAWNDACQPPWDADELAEPVFNAFRYAQNEPGACGILPAAERPAVKEYLAAHPDLLANDNDNATATKAGLPVWSTEEERRTQIGPVGRIGIRNRATQRQRPPTSWVIEGIIGDNETHIIHGPWGSFKSFLALDIALSIATGLPAFNKFPILRQGPVFYLAGEGLPDIEKNRVPAWLVDRGLPDDDRLRFYTVESVPQAAKYEEEAQKYVEDIRAALRPGETPGLVVVDTLARSLLGLDENSSDAANRYNYIVEHVKKALRCPVLTIAHEGKDSERGLRGSSGFPAGHDNVSAVEADTERYCAALKPIRFKSGETPEPLYFRGTEFVHPLLDKKGLAWRVTDKDGFKDATDKRRTGIKPGDVGAALKRLGATPDGEAVPTHVLATELAGDNRGDQKVIRRIGDVLRDGAATRFASYVAAPAAGRGTSILWKFPDVDAEDAAQTLYPATVKTSARGEEARNG